MRTRMNRIVCTLTVVVIISGLIAGSSGWVLDDRIHTGDRLVTPTAALPTMRDEQAVRLLKEEGLYDSLQKAVEATRYEMRREEQPASRRLPPAYYAPNPTQRMSVYFTSQGLYLAPQQGNREHSDIHRASDRAEWQAEMNLIGYGYGDSLTLIGPAELAAQDNRIEYRRAGLPLTEWYINKAQGLEQGFTIDTPPGVNPRGEPLRLVLELAGDLHAQLAEEGRAIALRQANGELALRYGDLHVYDAQGRELPSQLTLSGMQVILEVEDASAIYPVTIDPTITQQQKLTASDGEAEDSFGKSVAISGETVVVGAFADSIGSNDAQGSAYVFVRSGFSWSQQQKLTASDGARNDLFGRAVAISGNTVVVGADGVNQHQGAAYVFVRNGTSWSQQQKLTASDGATNDYFGYSVAVSDKRIVVGAFPDDIGSNSNQGSAYVFVRNSTTWSLEQKLTASDGGAFDNFGGSVAISGDTIVVGANVDDIGSSNNQGSAYVFTLSNMAWSQQQKLTASDGAAGDTFGTSVSISGNTLVVGAMTDAFGSNTDQGSAYVFVRSFGSWSEQQKLTASDGAAADWFGHSVAISGETVVVGTDQGDVGSNIDQGSAYVFVRTGTVWSQQQKLMSSDGGAEDSFGTEVSISGDTVIVGAPNHDIGSDTDRGSAYVYATWAQQQKLTAGDGAALDSLGYSVAISGETAAVGAPHDDVNPFSDQGSVYVFLRSGSAWSLQQKLIANDGTVGDSFGTSVAISGDTIVVGSPYDGIDSNVSQGSAYVFVRSDNLWSQQQKLLASGGLGGDNFGQSVSLSGETVVVGAPRDDIGSFRDQGSAYVFVRVGNLWNFQQQLTASDGAADDSFGRSVAISDNTVVAGAYLDDVGSNTDQGSAYVFVRSGTAWSQQQQLKDKYGAAFDAFGCAVAISGDTVVVGADGNDVGPKADQGWAYVFVRNGTSWSLQKELAAKDGAADDHFGISVAISGDTVVIGAYRDDIGSNTNQGSAYVFVRSGTIWNQRQQLTAGDGAASD